jgi:hypothetical protein
VLLAESPAKVVVLGTDLSHENAMVLIHGLGFISCGILLTAAGYVWKRWSALLLVASSALYLVHWFPFRSAYKYGLVATFKTRALLGMNPGYRLSFITRDIVLPIAFIAVIVILALGTRRRLSSPMPT